MTTVRWVSMRAEPVVIMPCEIMTADQVAELLQVSRDMVYQLATRGELPGRKVGRIWRFSREAIVEFLHGAPESVRPGTDPSGLPSRTDVGTSDREGRRENRKQERRNPTDLP